MLLRPYGIVIDGVLELGLEVEVENGRVASVRSHTGIPDEYVLSVAFVNAHSHLEYRGLMGILPTGGGYWDWIRAITAAKQKQTPEGIKRDCAIAADENRRTGVAQIGEHSDRPFAGEALAAAGVSGVIYQEVITFFERETREAKLEEVRARATRNRLAFGGPVWRAPHAYHTVDRQTLAGIGASGEPFSIHVAETKFESEFTRNGTGPIGDFYRANSVPFQPTGKSVVASLGDLGLIRRGAQFVHCCALESGEADLLATRGVTIAHCPRSNHMLGCPDAPIRELLDAGATVGLGLDSAASSGPIDMFAEMRAALETSRRRGKPVSAEEVWRMATTMGARSIPGIENPNWDIAVGSDRPLIAFDIPGAQTVEDLIDQGSPAKTRWIV